LLLVVVVEEEAVHPQYAVEQQTVIMVEQGVLLLELQVAVEHKLLEVMVVRLGQAPLLVVHQAH
jgi:hypothetical protein